MSRFEERDIDSFKIEKIGFLSNHLVAKNPELRIRFAKEFEDQEDTYNLRYIAPNIVQNRPEKDIVSIEFLKELKNIREKKLA